MKCPKCGTLLPDNAKFCGVCGQAFQQSQSQYQNQQQYNQQHYNQQQYNQQQYNYQQNQQYAGENSTVDRRIIVNPAEKVISSMQSSVVKTFLSGGGLDWTQMFFTNKRFYAKFKEISLLRGISNADVVVNLEHVTGTVLMQNNPIGLIIGAVFMFLLGIIGAAQGEPLIMLPFLFWAGLLVFLYFVGRRIKLKISYEGDSFIVPMKGCSYASADKFHKDLRNYLDRIKK